MTGHGANDPGNGSVRIEVSLPEAYLARPEEARHLVDELQAAVASAGMEVVRAGWTGTRSAADLAPWFAVVVTIAHAAGREIGSGFLQEVGAQGVEAIRRLVLRLARADAGDRLPEIRLEFRTFVKRGEEETTQEVALSTPRLRGDDPVALFDRLLDAGFVRADELIRSGEWGWLVYDDEGDRWLTQDELLTVRVRRHQRRQQDIEAGREAREQAGSGSPLGLRSGQDGEGRSRDD